MLGFKSLPWEYGIRNLLRRPLRSGLTFFSLTTVVLLVLIVVGFIRGLEGSLAVSGDPKVVLVYSMGMGVNLEYSSLPTGTAELLSASLDGIQQRYGKKYASPELYFATLVGVGDRQEPSMGLVRGVTPAALLVHRQVEIVEGDWPKLGEVLVGKLAASKLGVATGELDIGRSITFEGRSWRISGIFAASGSVFESELWCRLDELSQAMKRQDLSLVALTLKPDAAFTDVDVFCKERRDLELQAIHEVEYYESLQRHYRPVRLLAWLVVLLVSGAGVFAGLNTMHGAILGRVRELAMLQTLGFRRRAMVLSLIQEGTVLAAAASLVASVLAVALVHGAAVRFTMGAFQLQVDSIAVLAGCGTGLLLGVIGALPPAIRAMRMPVVEGLKAI